MVSPNLKVASRYLVVKIESERKKPKGCQNCGSISIRWYLDSKSNVMNQNTFSNISAKVGKPSVLEFT